MANAFSLHASCVLKLVRLMENLEHILSKGEANAAERDIDAEVFLSARLAPDMATLIQQVQFAASLAKNCPHRLAGTTPPVYAETETSFEELYGLITKTKAELSSFAPEDINGRESSEFQVKLGPRTVDFTALDYLNDFTLPNVYFHVTTAYNILRQNGVPLGKMDFFGGKM
jgi:hypothetical protein